MSSMETPSGASRLAVARGERPQSMRTVWVPFPLAARKIAVELPREPLPSTQNDRVMAGSSRRAYVASAVRSTRAIDWSPVQMPRSDVSMKWTNSATMGRARRSRRAARACFRLWPPLLIVR